MKTCENCGSRVYSLGCVNCDEEAYISEQERLTDQMEVDYDGPSAAQADVILGKRHYEGGAK